MNRELGTSANGLPGSLRYQRPVLQASMSTRSSPIVNGNGSANLDYINGHGALPDSPALAAPPPSTMSKKGKAGSNQKPQDDQRKTEKLLAARINELEQNTKGDKEQEAEIGMPVPLFPSRSTASAIWSSRSACLIRGTRVTPVFHHHISFMYSPA